MNHLLGTLDFYEQKKKKKDLEEHKKERITESKEMECYCIQKEKKRKRTTAVKCLRGSLSILDQREDKIVKKVKPTGSHNLTTATTS